MFVIAFTDQFNPITHSCWFAVTMGVGVLHHHQRWALHWWRLQGHVYDPCKWRFRRTPTPMEVCTYSEQILLCTFELEHWCFMFKIYATLAQPQLPIPRTANTLNILR
jgi:hypothetical protein